MIVTVTAYVHAAKDYATGKTIFRLNSFSTPLAGEFVVGERVIAIEIPDNFDLESELQKSYAKVLGRQLSEAESEVARLKKQLAGED